jgi:Protein of unknown function DUF72
LDLEWDASSSNFHRAFNTHARGSIAFSLSSIHHGGMSSRFGIVAGGENRCLPRFVIFCSCSGPRLPDELVKSAVDVYIRFHGAKRWYRHDYTREELAEWIAKIRAANPARVWAYFNNDRDGHAIKNARMFLRLLRA